MFRAFVPTVFSALVLVPLYAAGQSAQYPPAAPQQPETKLHANADLVLVDVTVNDARQNPVQHLTAADFTVLEDGKPQTVKVFEEHAARAALTVASCAQVPARHVYEFLRSARDRAR